MGSTRSLLLNLLLLFFALASAMLVITGEIAAGGGPQTCESSQSSIAPATNSSDLDAALQELTTKNYLTAGDLALCVGPGSAAAAAALSRIGLPSAVRSSATACCGLPFASDSFDLALAASLDRVRVPARIVLEMERVIRPGRVGLVLRIRSGPIRPDDLMKAAAPVASLLRFSDAIGARAVNGSAMVMFKKRGPHAYRSRCTEFTKLPLIVNEIIEYFRAAVLVVGGHYRQYALT